MAQGAALALGDQFKFDLWALPIKGDPVIERIWEARQPLRSTRIAPGAVLQVGVPLTLEGQERTGTGGPMRLHYEDGEQALSVDGTFEYTVTLDACNS